MAYIKDFQYLKPKNSYLQTFESTTTTTKLATPTAGAAATKDTTITGMLKQYFNEYCGNSSVHCFHYFADNKLKYYEKAMWFLIIMATAISCVVVYIDLAKEYYTHRIQTTVADSVYPVLMITFPSVGICLKNRIDWPRLHNEAPTKFLPPDASNQTLQTFLTFFDNLADIKFYTLHRLSPLFDTTANINLTLIDEVDILSVMEYLTFPCSEVLGKTCYWREKRYKCCDLFTLERTEVGFCYVFNSAVSEKAQEKVVCEFECTVHKTESLSYSIYFKKRNRYYPYHNSKAGEGSGLEVDVLLDQKKINPNSHFINGIYVMVKQPEQWHADVKFINYNTFTKLAITGQLSETDQMTRTVQPEVRRCLFEDETTHHMYKKIPGLIYWRDNCRTRCHQEYILKYCKCNLSLLFPANILDNFTICKPSDFKCIYENSNIFSKEYHELENQYINDVQNESMECNCLNSCNQLVYGGFYSSFPLEGINYSSTVKMVHMDIHFQTSYIIKYRTAMRYTFIELLANFGGIVGFFLGASLLSAIELVYYFTMGLYIRFHKQFEKKYRNKSTNSHKCHGKFKTVNRRALQPK